MVRGWWIEGVADLDKRAAGISTKKDDRKSRNDERQPLITHSRKVTLELRQDGISGNYLFRRPLKQLEIIGPVYPLLCL
jgi:hypothetical protein